MSEQARPFRYDDHYRLLDESLVDIKVAAPVVREPDVGGLERIAAGKTALASIPATRAAAEASVPHDLQKEEVKQKLRQLLEKKQTKISSFVERAAKVAGPIDVRAMHAPHGGDPRLSIHFDQEHLGAAIDSVLLERINKDRVSKGLQPVKSLRDTPPEQRKHAFMESTGQADSSATGIVTPSQMMSGNGSATDSRDTSTPREGVHQGPAANLIAAGLKQINSGKAP